MLPRLARVRTPADFTRVSRRGNRAAAATLVVQVLLGQPTTARRAGFIVSRKVGNSVVRHRVVRRLRALAAARLNDLPEGTDLVVRALPDAATAPSAVLAADFDAAMRHALRRARGGTRR